MRRILLIFLTSAALLAALNPGPASAAWPSFGSCKLKALRGNVVGGVLAKTDDSAWIFSTTLGRTLQEIHFSSRDIRRFHRDVAKGSLVVVADTETLDGQLYARTWCSVKKGNPLRADFLREFADEILVRALYGEPEKLAEIFARRPADLLPITNHVVGMAVALAGVGRREHLRPLAELVAGHGFIARAAEEETTEEALPDDCDVGDLHDQLERLTAMAARLHDSFDSHGQPEHSTLHTLAEQAQSAASRCL